MARRIRQRRQADAPRPRIGMRLWLGAVFAALGVMTAGVVYLVVSSSSHRVLSQRATELAIGQTTGLADRLGNPSGNIAMVMADAQDPGFSAWYFGKHGQLLVPRSGGGRLRAVAGQRAAVAKALAGGRFVQNRADGQLTVVALPVLGPKGVSGAVLSTNSRPQVLKAAFNSFRRDSLRALAVAVAIGILVGFFIASVIAYRVKRLARGAGEMAAGRLDVPLTVSGRDEIGDLARALDSMRAALRESFEVLSSERDKLSAIFAGLSDAVMVIDAEGGVRFANPAASSLISGEGEPLEPLVPHLRRAAERGSCEVPALRIGPRVYAVSARDLPAEQAVLAVVRDRTLEMQRELAEREFVSNAAHELRNPLAGISGTIEVLNSGAKDDPTAREHFLERLSHDAERMTRLTEALLALARVEALGAAEETVADVGAAIEEARARQEVPEGIELVLDVEPGLAAKGDPTLLRQVLTGLLTNALKNTPAPGTITVGAHREHDGHLLLEVSDTGTGIPAAELERVFERFYRASGAISQEGFGLGLAIAKRMVDVMEGDIGARSTEGRGSTFWVRLPAAEAVPTPVA